MLLCGTWVMGPVMQGAGLEAPTSTQKTAQTLQSAGIELRQVGMEGNVKWTSEKEEDAVSTCLLCTHLAAAFSRETKTRERTASMMNGASF